METEIKTENQIRAILDKINIDRDRDNFPGMTYEQGVEEALLWVLGEIEDDEFSFTDDTLENYIKAIPKNCELDTLDKHKDILYCRSLLSSLEKGYNLNCGNCKFNLEHKSIYN